MLKKITSIHYPQLNSGILVDGRYFLTQFLFVIFYAF
jgi:hypothetical protein